MSTVWKFYLAASYSRQAELRQIREGLQNLGYGVTSRWLDQTAPHDRLSLWPMEAARDMEDVRAADYFVVFTSPGVLATGHHVELGLALAWRKPYIIVGPPEGLFYTLPSANRFDTVDEFLGAATRWAV